MKYTGLLIVLAAMFWTWHLSVSNSSHGGQEMHQEVVAQMETKIREALAAKRPNLKDVAFRQLYTEVVKPGSEMRVHFRFESAEGTEESGMVDSISEGIMTLLSTDQGATWIAKTDQFGTPFIRFREGSKISPKDGTESPAGTEGESKRQ